MIASPRTTIRIHVFIQYVQGKMETNFRFWRYLLRPGEEQEGHEIMGSLPVLELVVHTDHFICQTGHLSYTQLTSVLAQMAVTSAT